MGPKRKASAAQSGQAAEDAVRASLAISDSAATIKKAENTEAANSSTERPSNDPTSPTSRRSSWYGSWRTKASPVARIAKESISVAQGTTSESSEAAAQPPPSVSKSFRGSSRKSIPLAAEATRVHATSGSSQPKSPEPEKIDGNVATNEVKPEELVTEITQETAENVAVADTESINPIAARPQSGGWFGWWSRPDGYGSDSEKSNKRRKQDPEVSTIGPTDAITTEATVVVHENNADTGPIAASEPVQQMQEQPSEATQSATPARSWFSLWSQSQTQQTPTAPPVALQASAVVPEDVVPDTGQPLPKAPVSTDTPPSHPKPDSEGRPKSSGWVFWSYDKPKDSIETPGGTQKQVGELAVADTPSQSHPEAAQYNEERIPKPSMPKSVPAPRQFDRGKGQSKPSPAIAQVDETAVASAVLTHSGRSADGLDIMKSSTKGKSPQARPNLLLPSLRSTITQAPNPGYMERIASYLAQSLHLHGSSPLSNAHQVYLTPSPPTVKRAIALGVHGFFPTPLVSKVLGQPTGTSIRFANYAATSVKAWCQEHQPDVKNVEIEKVALEGEGTISDRVSTLWKLLLNWLHQLRQADFIFVACHSQGVPVAIMLLAKLLQLNCLASNVRIGVCAMAGINLGPFTEYRSRFFGGSALELFDFCDSKSKVSRNYADALDVCLRSGVRLTFVGSIDDQLVSLESSLHMPLSHPHIYRAVFIDGRLHTSNFLTSLVAFSLKLRNMGISDHGLIRELSGPLAGSLVSGEGHSRIYDEAAVYALAIEFALETTEAQPITFSATAEQVKNDKAREAALTRRASMGGIPSSPAIANSIRRGSISGSAVVLPGIAPTFAPYEPPPSSGNANPFILPWSVRGVLEEDVVKKEMRDAVDALVKEFEEWKPVSKVLKDVRWRLEAVRNMA